MDSALGPDWIERSPSSWKQGYCAPMSRFLVLIGWRSGPDSLRFADAPFGVKVAVVLVVSLVIVLIGKYIF
jgi:hypothetical protein